MRRSIPLCLAVVVTLVALPAANAEGPSPRAQQEELEALIADLEGLVSALDGESKPSVQKVGSGYWATVIPLSAAEVERLGGNRRGRFLKTATFKAMDNGHSKSRPRTANKMTTHPNAKPNLRYWFWFCVYNLSNNPNTKTFFHKLTGPGERFNNTVSFQFAANAIVCLWLQHDALGETGSYTHTLKVQTGGKAKEIFVAQ